MVKTTKNRSGISRTEQQTQKRGQGPFLFNDFIKNQTGFLELAGAFEAQSFRLKPGEISGCRFDTQRGEDLTQNRSPITGSGLAENTHGRIPRTVGAVVKPAPFAGKRQQQPDRFAQRAGQVRRSSIDTYDEVELLDDRRRGSQVGAMRCGVGGVGRLAKRDQRVCLKLDP